jgi:hypothetical protein
MSPPSEIIRMRPELFGTPLLALLFTKPLWTVIDWFKHIFALVVKRRFARRAFPRAGSVVDHAAAKGDLTALGGLERFWAWHPGHERYDLRAAAFGTCRRLPRPALKRIPIAVSWPLNAFG